MTERNLLGAFEEMVLLAVARGEGDAYGMSVRRDVQARSGRDVTIGAVYATLDRLEAKQMVSSTTRSGEDARGGQARRCFELSAEGASALLEARERHHQVWRDLDLDALADVAGAGK